MLAGNQFTLEPDSRASNQGLVVRGVPVFGQVREQLPNGFADNAMGRVNARLRNERAVGFNIGEVQRAACRGLHFLDHTKPVVQRFKQRTIVGVGGDRTAGKVIAGASRIGGKMAGRQACAIRQISSSARRSVR